MKNNQTYSVYVESVTPMGPCTIYGPFTSEVLADTWARTTFPTRKYKVGLSRHSFIEVIDPTTVTK